MQWRVSMLRDTKKPLSVSCQKFFHVGEIISHAFPRIYITHLLVTMPQYIYTIGLNNRIWFEKTFIIISYFTFWHYSVLSDKYKVLFCCQVFHTRGSLYYII